MSIPWVFESISIFQCSLIIHDADLRTAVNGHGSRARTVAVKSFYKYVFSKIKNERKLKKVVLRPSYVILNE